MQFSVIVPAKNAAPFLADAVKSALSQENTTVEVIIVDDGSSDQTLHIAQKLRDSDDRIVILTNQISVGVSAARNQAIAVAQGEWIAILDADDEFLPGRLSKIVQEANRDALDMFADNLALKSETGDDLGIAFIDPELQHQTPVSLEVFVTHDMPRMQPMGIGFCKPIIKNSFLRNNKIRYRQGVKSHEDFLFYSECLLAGARLGFSHEAGYLYTVRSSGYGTAFNLQISEINRIITEAAKTLQPSAVPVLQMRQHAIDYDAFTKSLYAKRYSEALASLSRLPSSFLARRITKLAVGRTKILLASIRH